MDIPPVDTACRTAAGWTFPTFRQSLLISKNFYEIGHWALDGIADDPLLSALTLLGFDGISLWLPGGASWLHEEWHRALLSRRGISSRNDVYDMNLFAETIAVSHVRDDDLAALKNRHPAEFVRLSAAGIEGQYELNFALEKDAFYEGVPLRSLAILWFNTVNSIAYVYLCGTREADRMKREANARDGSNVQRRDFTGLDFTAWVYDLFRPEEPYENRGPHPSGVGSGRDRGRPDLTAEERRFLRLQGALQCINLIDPFLIGRTEFRGRNPFSGEPLRWNAVARHHLTSFGYTLDANLLVCQGKWNGLLVLHQYVNHDAVLPGIEAQLLRYPIGQRQRPVRFSPMVAIWLQPEDQAFRTGTAELGGMLGVRFDMPFRRFGEVYLEISGKTDGWRAGDPNLDAGIGGVVGYRREI